MSAGTGETGTTTLTLDGVPADGGSISHECQKGNVRSRRKTVRSSGKRWGLAST